MRANSIHSILISSCFTIKNKSNRVYVATMGQHGDCRVYCDNKLLGYLKPKRKNNFLIQFSQDGLLFETKIKYNDVILFGKNEKLPQQRISHKKAERIMNKNFDFNNGISIDEKK